MTIQERLRRSNFIMLMVPAVLAGIGCSIHAIRAALQTHRSAMVWLILSLMLGSLYAIANGPASLDIPQPPLTLVNFQLPAFLLGAALLLALELLKKTMKHHAPKGAQER